MLTIFAWPKPFRGHIATIQRNAIGSWARLRPSCQILLFGSEEGTAETAREFDVCHVPDVARNEYGTLLLDDVFEKARKLSNYELLCYINCDIVLMNDFIQGVKEVSQWRKRFLMIGECRNLDITDLTFNRPNWEEYLRAEALQRGRRRGPYANDYFVFPRDFYEHLLPLALGRAYFDHWLIWKARALKAAVVDATPTVLAVHQNHDYSHISGGKDWSYHGEEAKRSMELIGGRRHCAYTHDATHRLKQSGIEWNFVGYFRLRSHKSTLRIIEWGWQVLDWTRPIRHLLGLRVANLDWLKASLSRQK